MYSDRLGSEAWQRKLVKSRRLFYYSSTLLYIPCTCSTTVSIPGTVLSVVPGVSIVLYSYIPCPPFCGNRAKSGRYLVNFIFLYCRKASKPPLTSKIGFSWFQLDGIHPWTGTNEPEKVGPGPARILFLSLCHVFGFFFGKNGLASTRNEPRRPTKQRKSHL